MENTKQESNLEGNEIVISGMSGIFPKSDNVLQFMENLYNKVDMVMTVNSGLVHPNLPNYLGKINGLEKFDAHFFKVPVNQAISMDPLFRKLMEQSYGAIYDAGVNPLALGNTRIGVYVGMSHIETIIYNWDKDDKTNTFMMSGCALAMMANRISYYLNARGPSYVNTSANASSLISLDLAYRDLKAGVIDGAIVAGSSRCMIPSLSINLKRCSLLCDDGKTKCFDKNGDGYVRSEAASVLFLQRAKDAKRIYCEVYGTRTKYSKPDIHTPIVRCEEDIMKHFEEFYSEVKVNPSDVEYFEANASGIASYDEMELKAIDKFFGGRSKINVGSVKSNMGHSEGASGLCALTKICLAYHKGLIPPNINIYDAIENTENSVLVKQNTPFGRGYAAINELSYTGIDCHALLKGYFKPKDTQRYKSNIPYLIFSSGRQQSCVDYLFDVLESYTFDPEYIGMLHNIHNNDVKGHTSRGYIILDKDINEGTVTLSRNVGHYSGNKRQVWFVFSGMGSQWVGMGAELMRIQIFSESIKKCDNVLRSKGIDIIKILTEKDDTIFDNILNCFVGIAAVQIGLIDILRAVGIECDYMIGHSVGETACGYADGCFTAEEMILSAYSRGIASLKTNLIPGAMAAVGLGFNGLHSLCPPDIDIACHNSSTSSTISGPAESISKFVKELKMKGIFAKEVPTSNIAYHSRYIAEAGPSLRSLLEDVIITPKLRSDKWLSTSVTENNWHKSYAQYSSPEYFTNNLLNSVYFEETSQQIPPDAIVIEVAPHGLLQAVLKRSHPDCLHIPLTRREAEDPVKFLLQALGKIYQAGVCVKIDALYPKINWPVSTGTPFLSHLIKWEHSEDWPTFNKDAQKHNSTSHIRTREIAISLFDENYIYLQGYARNGVIVFPESALLVLTWETLGIFMNTEYRHLSVVFKNLKFNDQIIVNTKKILKLSISINHEGRFEVMHENKVIVSGFVAKMKDRETRVLENSNTKKENDINLNESDIYKCLNLRNYVYGDDFRSIYSLNPSNNKAHVKWSGNWVTFIDGLIQINTFIYNNDETSKPKLIESLTIDVHDHLYENHQIQMNGNILYKAEYFTTFDVLRSGGVELVSIVYEDVVPEHLEPDFVGTKQFWPSTLKREVDLNTALHINIQMIAEDVANKEINIIDLSGSKVNVIYEVLKVIITKIPVEIKINSIDIESCTLSNQCNDFNKPDVLIVDELSFEKLTTIYDMLPSNGYVLALVKRQNKIYIDNTNLFNIITSYHIAFNNIIVLLKKNENNQTTEDMVLVEIENIESLKNVFNNKNIKSHTKTILFSERDYSEYLRSLQEEYGTRIRLFQILDSSAPPFNLKNEFYRKQFLKNLLYNTLLDGEWGGYYYTPINHCNLITQKSNLKLKQFDDLQFLEPATLEVPTDYVQVKCTSISLADSDKLMSNYYSKNITYQDFSGIDKCGNRVMGLIAGKTNFRNIVPDFDLLWPVPDHWTLEEAATVPHPYVHAFYCLAIRSKLRRNQTVFINGAGGALGQALTAICLSLNCDVYVSVRDIYHKICLLKIFPELNENKVLCALNSNFDATVNSYTNNSRCDFVINTEEGFLRESAMKCVAVNGYFLDMSKVDVIENKQFGLTYLWECKNYKAVEVSNIFRPENHKDKKELHSMITEAIAKGIVRPTPHVTYSSVDLSKDVSLLVSQNYTEEIIVTLEDQVTSNAKIGLILNDMHTFLIIGGQDEICIGLVNLLVEKGANSVFLNLDTECITSFLQLQLWKWKHKGVLVKIGYHKIDDHEECRNLFNDAAAMGPIGGVFIVLNSVQSLRSETGKGNDLPEVCQKKSSLINLDNVSRDITSIRYFAILSRNVTTIEDEFLYSVSRKICELRNFIGLPSFLYRADFVNETQRRVKLNENQQVQPQTVREILNCFKKVIGTAYSNVLSFNTNKNVKIDYVQKVAEAIDMKYTKESDLQTLKYLDEIKIENLRSLIHDCYDLNVPVEELKKMSLESVHNINLEMSKYYNNDLNVFLSNFEHDPYEEVESMKLMQTSLHENLEKCYEVVSIDPAADYLLLLPGFEGNHRIFETLCLSLEIKAMTYELGPELAGETIPEMAKNIMKNLPLKFDNKKKFYILGYSFGVNLALELAALLEKKGLIGVIFCLDTSPETLRIQIKTYTSNLTESEFQDSLINHIYSLVTKKTNMTLQEELKKYKTFDKKVDLFIQIVKKEVCYSHEYFRLILESTYKRMILSLNYNPTFILNSEIILVKSNSPTRMEYSEDYNLSNFTNKPVSIFNVNTEHKKVPSDVQVPAVINKILRLIKH